MGKSDNSSKLNKNQPQVIGPRSCFLCGDGCDHFLKAPAFDVFCPQCAVAQEKLIHTPRLDSLRAAGVKDVALFSWGPS